ncbi:iron chelate uptake ABC transporter family permease subunit, partial [Ochrobactrum sp. S45]|nr:iron chelate uptake ABC transporter family permease subunit [Ochrobactrum sp. S45]
MREWSVTRSAPDRAEKQESQRVNQALLSELPGRAPALSRQAGFWFLLCGLGILISICFVSLLVGTRMLSPDVLLHALLGQNRTSAAQIILLDYRLPRTLLGLLCGA